MSLDRSLKSATSLVRHRNVLTRAERLEKLKETERWTDQKSVFGLPKVAHRKQALAKAEKEETPAEGTPAAAGAAAAAPAAGAKGAAGAKAAAPAAGAKGAAAPKAAAGKGAPAAAAPAGKKK